MEKIQWSFPITCALNHLQLNGNTVTYSIVQSDGKFLSGQNVQSKSGSVRKSESFFIKKYFASDNVAVA